MENVNVNVNVTGGGSVPESGPASGPAVVPPSPPVLGVAERMDELRSHGAYALDGDDWASALAERLVVLLGGYLDDQLPAVGSLPAGLEDPMEKYVRDCAAVSPAVSEELMLPAAYAYAGALGGGGLWAAWNGRGSWQVVPLTVQAVGLAVSGGGKSSMQKLLSVAVKDAVEHGSGAVMKHVSGWAAAARDMVGDVCSGEWDKLVSEGKGPKSDEILEVRRVRQAVLRLINDIELDAAGGVRNVYADATAEALVSGAIEYGGAAFVQAAEQDILDNLVRYSAGGGSASLTFFTDGWDGAGYERARRGSGFESTSALVVSMSLMTQYRSFVDSFSSGGAAWLDKGLLGRAWLTRARAVPEEDLLAADLARKQFLAAGGLAGGAVALPEQLEDALDEIAYAGAECRAARMLEGRLVRAARQGKVESSPLLMKALTAAGASSGVPVTTVSIAREGGAGGAAGTVLGVGAGVGERLEDVFTWLKVCFETMGREDPVLTPVMTRLVHHLVRLAGLRTVLLGRAGSGLVCPEVLEDTAVRVLPWLLGLHLEALGGVVSVRSMEAVRREMVAGRGKDTSFGGQIADALKAGCGGQVPFPLSVSEVVAKAARGRRGVREWRSGIRDYMKEQYEAQVERGEPGDGYFLMGKGRKSGSMIVAGFGSEALVYGTPAAALVVS